MILWMILCSCLDQKVKVTVHCQKISTHNYNWKFQVEVFDTI